jgi:hypothetical protein
VVSVVCFLAGFFLSSGGPRDLPTGATIVAVNLAVFGIFSFAGWLLGKRRAAHTDH